MTAAQSSQSKPAAAQNAVGHDGFHSIGGTCGDKAAAVRQNRGEKNLIEADGKDEESAQKGHVQTSSGEVKVPVERIGQLESDIVEPESSAACLALGDHDNAGGHRQAAQMKTKALPQDSLNTIADHRMPCFTGYGSPQADTLIAFGWRCNKKKEMPGMHPPSLRIAQRVFGRGTYQTFLRQ